MEMPGFEVIALDILGDESEKVPALTKALEDAWKGGSLAERIRELCAAQGSCGEAGCTAVATCDLLRVLDDETAR